MGNKENCFPLYFFYLYISLLCVFFLLVVQHNLFKSVFVVVVSTMLAFLCAHMSSEKKKNPIHTHTIYYTMAAYAFTYSAHMRRKSKFFSYGIISLRASRISGKEKCALRANNIACFIVCILHI